MFVVLIMDTECNNTNITLLYISQEKIKTADNLEYIKTDLAHLDIVWH